MDQDGLEVQSETLKSDLLDMEVIFSDLKRRHQVDKKTATWDLSSKTQMALTATMILTMRMSGQFDPSQKHPDLDAGIDELEAYWREARDSAEAFSQKISFISSNLVFFWNNRVEPWHHNADMLRRGLEEKLKSTQEALQQDKGRLYELELRCNDSQEALAALQQRFLETQQKFDDLTKWLWNSPETRLLQQSFRIVVDSLAHEIVYAEAESKSAARALEASQASVASKEADVRQLASASKAQFELLTQGVALLHTSTTLLEEIQSMQAEVSSMRGKRNAAWDLVSRFIHWSQQGDLVLHKEDYARLVLQIVETLLEEDSLHLTLAGIVKHLAENDDERSSVRGLVDKHPEGLLSFVSSELGLPEGEMTTKRQVASQEATKWPLSEEHVQEHEEVMAEHGIEAEARIRVESEAGVDPEAGVEPEAGVDPEARVDPAARVEPEDEVAPEDQGEAVKTAEDESDSEWDKVSVPFKPYGDFDRSSIRIRLSYKDPLPIEQAGQPPCSEPKGSPVYLASAVDLDGSKQPCKYSPALQPNGVRVPYRGEEIRHRGDFELLPYIPELMEFVGAKNGQLPAGRRGVVGGHEQGGQLYHAIAKVGGVWVPGKTGEHMRGAAVAFGDMERRAKNYKILQVASDPYLLRLR